MKNKVKKEFQKSEGFILVQLKDNSFTYKDAATKEVLSERFLLAENIHNGFGVVKTNKGFQFFNPKTRKLSKDAFLYAQQVGENGFALVRLFDTEENAYYNPSWQKLTNKQPALNVPVQLSLLIPNQNKVKYKSWFKYFQENDEKNNSHNAPQIAKEKVARIKNEIETDSTNKNTSSKKKYFIEIDIEKGFLKYSKPKNETIPLSDGFEAYGNLQDGYKILNLSIEKELTACVPYISELGLSWEDVCKQSNTDFTHLPTRLFESGDYKILLEIIKTELTQKYFDIMDEKAQQEFINETSLLLDDIKAKINLENSLLLGQISTNNYLSKLKKLTKEASTKINATPENLTKNQNDNDFISLIKQLKKLYEEDENF